MTCFGGGDAQLEKLEFNAKQLSPALLADTCATVLPLFQVLGFALKFAGDDFKSKVNTVKAAAATHSTIISYIEADMVRLSTVLVSCRASRCCSVFVLKKGCFGGAQQAGTVQKKNGNTRDTLRLVRGLHFVAAFLKASATGWYVSSLLQSQGWSCN